MNIAAVVSLNTIYIICVLYSVVYVQVASSSCLSYVVIAVLCRITSVQSSSPRIGHSYLLHCISL